MDEDNQINQGSLEKQKLEQLENELENIENKTTQEIPSQPNQPIQQPSTPQPVSPVSPIDPKPQGLGKSKGILWIGIALLVLALVGVGAYFLGSRKTATTITPEPVSTQTPTPTPDLTVNWKTYTDEENGWSIKYPQEWKLQEDTLSSLNTDWYEPMKLVVLSESEEPIEEAIRIYIHTDNGYTLQDWLNNKDRDNPEIPVEHEDGYYYGAKIPSQTNYVLGGNPAITLEIDQEKIKGNYVFLAKNGLIYDIAPLGEEGEMVLSTFKLIDRKAFVCPELKTIDCMPSVGGSLLKYCASDYVEWIGEYCPGVGIVY